MLIHYCIALLTSPKSLALKVGHALFDLVEIVFSQHLFQVTKLSLAIHI